MQTSAAKNFSGKSKYDLAAQIVVCLLSIFTLSQPANAQGLSSIPGADSAHTGSSTFLAQNLPLPPTSSTVIPTDVLPLPAIQTRMTFGENLQLRLLQKLPSRFYMSSSVETSFRYETNPYQFPNKRTMLGKLPPPSVFRTLNAFQQAQIYDILGLSNNDDMVFRVLPNVTGGWTVNPRTRIFCNYFMIRDSLFRNIRLNTVIHSISYGVQRDIPIGSRGNLQAEFQARELYQLHQQPVFDFLPGLTFSYVVTPRMVVFVNALAQLRGKAYFQAPTKEIDPFYTWGALYQRNGWTFSASSTFLQNFREPFRQNATVPINNYSFISDFEIARRLFKQVPGLQAFVRAEPIYNFHSNNTPGLAGMDFRLFFGLRMAMAKPALTATLEQLRQQLEEQEAAPTTPGQSTPKQQNQSQPQPTKPSAYIKPYDLTAHSLQPIHGFLSNEYKPAINVANAPSKAEKAKSETKVKVAHKPAKQKIAKVEKAEKVEKIEKAETKNDKPMALIADKTTAKADLKMVLIPPFPAISMDKKGRILVDNPALKALP